MGTPSRAQTFPMDTSDGDGDWYYSGGGPPPAPGAGGVAAQQAISMLQQHAQQMQQAMFLQVAAHVDGLAHAHRMERQRMEVPIQILPQQPRHTTHIIREHVPHPTIPAPPPADTGAIQALNVQLANAQGAAAAHARQSSEALHDCGRR